MLKFTEDHEWILLEGDIATIGITDYAQKSLGDVVFVELPAVGTDFAKGDEMAVVESVKAASEVYAPVDGEVSEVNSALEDEPALVNTEAMDGGWFVKCKVSDPASLNELMDESAYSAFIEGL